MKDKHTRHRLINLKQIWGLISEMPFSDKGRMDETHRLLTALLGLSGLIANRETPIQTFTDTEC